MGIHGRRGAKAAHVVALEALVCRPLRNKLGARHAAALASAALVVLFMPLVLVCLAAASPLVALAYTAWHMFGSQLDAVSTAPRYAATSAVVASSPASDTASTTASCPAIYFCFHSLCILYTFFLLAGGAAWFCFIVFFCFCFVFLCVGPGALGLFCCSTEVYEDVGKIIPEFRFRSPPKCSRTRS